MLPPGRPLGVRVTFDHTAAIAKQWYAWECERGSRRLKNQTVVTRFFLSSHGPLSLAWDLD